VNEVPLEEAEPARKAFGDLTEGEREVVRDALVAIGHDPAVGREIPGWRPPSVEYTYTTPRARDSAEAITVVYTHTPGMGVTVVHYFRDPQVVE
jgi:peptidoglycan/xylan/chitin deacetylase (PgdA/CDA1 family)